MLSFMVLKRLIFLLLAMAAALPVHSQQLPFGHYTIEDGLVDSVIMVIFQDSRGFLWFGTRAGLNRFDGFEFKTFTSDDGLCHNVIRDLYEAGDGSLWIATERGLSRLVDSELSCVVAEDELPYHSIRCIEGDDDGSIWFGTYGGGLCHLANGKIETFSVDDGLAHNKVRSLARAANGDLWIGTSGGGASRLRNGIFETFGEAEGLAHNEVRTLWVEDGGDLIAGTRKGLYRLSGERFVPVFDDNNLSAEAYNTVIQDKKGRLWLGTREAGAASLADGKLTRYLTEDGLADNSVMAIYDDNEGNLWFGTYGGGVDRLSTESILNYEAQDGFAYDNVYCLTEDSQGNLWFGTNGGGVSRLSDGVFTTFTTADGLGHNKVISAMVDHLGRPWFGTLEGASLFVGDHFETITTGDGLAHNIVYDIHESADLSMWFATFEGLTHRYDGTYTTYTVDDGLPDSRVNYVLETQKGDFWFGTADGLSYFSDGSFENFTVDDGLVSEFVNVIFEDPSGDVWAGTNRGLSRLSDGKFINYTVSDGLSHNSCTEILLAEDGALWIGTSRGVNRFDGQSFSVVTSKEGLVSDLVNRGGGFKDRDGNLWFGTNGGVSRIDADYSGAQIDFPSVFLESARVFDKAVDLHENLVLQHDQNYLKFDFVGISFRRANDVVYRYRLKGLDLDWNESRQRSVQYTSLRPGDYTFEVSARTSIGSYNPQTAQFSFSIVPPFWKRPLFVAGVLILIIGAVAYRVYSLKRRTVILEAKVRERTAEVEEINEELRWLALNDRLTNLRNRHYIYEIMPEEMSRLKRRLRDARDGDGVSPDSSRLGLAIVDLDFFKKVNDEYDHIVGDLVLKDVARLFSEVTRDSDVVARWGGEEFLILYRDVDAVQLGTMAHRLLEGLRTHPISISEGQQIRLTCSVGFTHFPGHVPTTSYSWEDIIRIADIALFEAKATGRDRAVGFTYESGLQGELLMTSITSDVRNAVENGFLKRLE